MGGLICPTCLPYLQNSLKIPGDAVISVKIASFKAISSFCLWRDRKSYLFYSEEATADLFVCILYIVIHQHRDQFPEGH